VKNLFLAIPILLILVGCGYLPATDMDDRLTFDINRGADEVLVDGEIAWRVAFATDELLSEYDSYVEFAHDERGRRIFVVPYITLYDFQWIEVRQEEFKDYQQSVLYSAGDLLVGVPFVTYHWELGTSPHRGLSFVDANGERRYFAIGAGQTEAPEAEGWFIIYEFDNL